MVNVVCVAYLTGGSRKSYPLNLPDRRSPGGVDSLISGLRAPRPPGGGGAGPGGRGGGGGNVCVSGDLNTYPIYEINKTTHAYSTRPGAWNSQLFSRWRAKSCLG